MPFAADNMCFDNDIGLPRTECAQSSIKHLALKLSLPSAQSHESARFVCGIRIP